MNSSFLVMKIIVMRHAVPYLLAWFFQKWNFGKRTFKHDVCMIHAWKTVAKLSRSNLINWRSNLINWKQYRNKLAYSGQGDTSHICLITVNASINQQYYVVLREQRNITTGRLDTEMYSVSICSIGLSIVAYDLKPFIIYHARQTLMQEKYLKYFYLKFRSNSSQRFGQRHNYYDIVKKIFCHVGEWNRVFGGWKNTRFHPSHMTSIISHLM